MDGATTFCRFRNLAALLLASMVLAGCTLLPAGRASNSGLSEGEEPTPTPIATPIAVKKPTYRVQRGEITRRLIVGGRIVPVVQKDLYFRAGGRVRTVFVRSGATVKAGQVLADLEMADLERELQGKELDLERVQARASAAEADLAMERKRAQANLAIAQEKLAIVRAQDPAPRQKAAEVALQRADLARQQAQAAYDKIASRSDRSASPEAAALQQATLNYEAAQAAYELVLQDVAVHGHQVTIAEHEVELAQFALDDLSRGLDPLLLNDVEQAKLAVAKLEASVSDRQLIAPIDGQVDLDLIVSEGTGVEAFKYVARVSDPSVLEAHCEVSNDVLRQLSLNMPATVSLVSRPGVDVSGRIRRLPSTGGLASSAQDKDLRIALDASPQDAGYAWGDLIRITIVLEQRRGVLWLPPAAIRTFEGRKFVVVQEDAGQRRVDVTLGLESEDRVEITAGLTEGQVVVGP